jgi:hypothetical protein
MTTLEQIVRIQQQHGGLESNIPYTHCYWDLVRQYRSGTDHALPCVFNPEPLNVAPPPPPQAQDKIRLAALRKFCRDTVRDFGGEANIPYTHDYWFSMNVIKSIERQPE